MAAKKRAKKKTAKKKKPLSKKALRERAKKGWITRRKQPFEVAIENAVSKDPKKTMAILGLKPRKPKPNKIEPEWVQRLEGYSRDQLLEIAKANIITSGWVTWHDPAYLHSGVAGGNQRYNSGTIALQPSRARHMGKLTKWALKKMKQAKKRGEGWFNRAVDDIAETLDLPVREIYTLWYSP